MLVFVAILYACRYGVDSEEDTQRQKAVLREHMNLIRYIQCDENPFECQSAGVTQTPSWNIDGKVYPVRLIGVG